MFLSYVLDLVFWFLVGLASKRLHDIVQVLAHGCFHKVLYSGALAQGIHDLGGVV